MILGSMKIVVLDGHTLNPGDLTWDELDRLGDLTVFDRSAPEEVLSRSQGAEILLTNKTILDRKLIESLPDLKYIGVLATGYNVVDTVAAKEHGIVVTNTPAYSTASVAQMVFALLLAVTNRVEHYTAECRDGRWSNSVDFTYWDSPLEELSGKTFGIVGLGNIGMSVARIAVAFGMKVLALSSKPVEVLPDGVSKAGSLEELLRESDVVSLHCPLTDNTRHMINASTLKMMKPSAILINTGRGPLVDEQALADALNRGELRAAAVDVLSSEPPAADNPLLSARNCYVTPHIAWASVDARRRLMDLVVGNVAAFLEGKPVNVVN